MYNPMIIPGISEFRCRHCGANAGHDPEMCPRCGPLCTPCFVAEHYPCEAHLPKVICILVDLAGRPVLVDDKIVYLHSGGDGLAYTTDPAEAWPLDAAWAEHFARRETYRLAKLSSNKDFSLMNDGGA